MSGHESVTTEAEAAAAAPAAAAADQQQQQQQQQQQKLKVLRERRCVVLLPTIFAGCDCQMTATV
jgi:lipid-binding SYLF domain-containing protein